MNIDEINRITDYHLREIRLKYWNMRHKAFQDEYRIPDRELGQIWDEMTEKEEKEISEYLEKQKELK